MKKIVIIFAVLLIAVFVVVQFFQPEKNEGEVTADHLFSQEDVPENIKTMLQTSCLDCHSNQTNYLWYHRVSPVSWLISGHIRDGKDELNLSEWSKMDVYDKLESLEDMCKEVERGKMPIKPYLRMHPKAKLSEEQKKELCAWSEKLSEKLMEQAMQ